MIFLEDEKGVILRAREGIWYALSLFTGTLNSVAAPFASIKWKRIIDTDTDTDTDPDKIKDKEGENQY